MDDGAALAADGRSLRAAFPIDPGEVEAAIGNGEPAQTTPTMQAVGALVRRLRDEARLSLASLAAAAELSPGLLSQIERGMGNPSFTTLIKLAHALDSFGLSPSGLVALDAGASTGGFTSATTHASGLISRCTAGSTRLSEMKATSITAQSARIEC